MQRFYAVVRTDRLAADGLLSIHGTQAKAMEEIQTLRRKSVYADSVPLAVVKMTLSPMHEEVGDRMERFEHEIRTLRTLLTALNGRVAELSKVSTPPF